jgi:hypothetical protein
MKARIYLPVLFGTFLIAGIAFWSCTKEESVQIAQGPAIQGAKSGIAVYHGCEDYCVDGTGTTSMEMKGVVSGTVDESTKIITYKVYNTETDFVLVVGYDRSTDNPELGSTISVMVNGIVQSKLIGNHQTATYFFPLSGGLNPKNPLRFAIVETGEESPEALAASGTYSWVGKRT